MNKIRKKGRLSRWIAMSLAVIMSMSATLVNASAAAWNPAGGTEQFTQLRFWEDEEPGVRFYINAAARYNLESVAAPIVGSTKGEWLVMGLLRGMYMGLDYMNDIPSDYFSGYHQRLEDYVSERSGVLHRTKSTEWSRVMLAVSALGQDPSEVAGYDFIDKLSQSFAFSYKQGLNGPIWELIAMDTGDYEFYENPSEVGDGGVTTRGKLIDYIVNEELKNSTVTLGGWVLNKAYATGAGADPDITGMALQALAPYYLDSAKYAASGAETPYSEFVKVVERGVYSLYQRMSRSGGFGGWGSNNNAESTAQAVVALTALNIDPKAIAVELPHIGKTARFLTPGATYDGVTTNNMIDALLTFWAKGSGSSEAVGGFKHVTTGSDGGGGTGYGVNAMATEQVLYALIAYDRYMNGQKRLYDMTDMSNGSYAAMQAASYRITYMDESGRLSESHAPYEEVDIPVGTSGAQADFVCWNTKADGSGTVYLPGEVLSMPEQDITLYAQYGAMDFTLSLELGGGTLSEGVTVPKGYSPFDEDIQLPSGEQISREGYTFAGWYDNAEFKGDPVTALAKGSYGNKTFYAKWNVNYENIRKLGSYITKVDLNQITIADRRNIRNARAVYEQMTEVERSQLVVTVTYYPNLVKAEEALKLLEESMEAAEIVISLIDSLGDTIELSQESDLLEARAQYEALAEKDRGLVTNYEKLLTAEEQLTILKQDQAAADAVAEAIQAIGEVSLGTENAIVSARMQYQGLTEKQKQLLDSYYVDLLAKAESCLDELKQSQKRIERVLTLIEAIPDSASLDNESLQAASDAKAAYLALTTEEKSEIPAASVSVIENTLDALATLARAQTTSEDDLIVNDVVMKIAGFGGEIDASGEARLLEARAAYEALTTAQRALVDNYFSLISLELQMETIRQDQTAAAAVDAQIAAIGEVTLEKKDQIEQARANFLALSVSQKKLVTKLQELAAAETALSELKYNEERAQKTTDRIQAIGTVTLESKEAILQAEKSYEALSDAQKALIDPAMLQLLTEARAAYDELYRYVLKSITLSENDVVLEPGDTRTLTVAYDPADTTSDKTVIWQSSDEKIVTVKDGVLTAISNGEAAVMARVGQLSAVCAVHVETPLTGLTISAAALKMAKGDFEYLTVGYLPANTTAKPKVTWESSNTQVATVDAGGKVTGTGNGTATITARAGGFKVSCKVTSYHYKLSYKLNGGTNSGDNPPGYSGKYNVTLKAPTRAGYTFGGWYSDSKYKNKVTTISKGKSGNISLYAKWTAVTAPGKPTISKLSHKAANSMLVVLKGKVSGAEAYEILYADNSSMKNASKVYTTAYKGKTIKSLTTGKTYYVKVRAYKKDSTGAKIYGAYSSAKKVTLTIPATPSIKSLANSASRKMKVTLSRSIYKAHGYQIVYATNSKFTSGKKTVNTTSISKTISGLSKGKTYYVKVRAMTKINGKNTYGAYSSVKKVKIK